MATTYNEYTGDGSTSLFAFTFPYIERSDVVVSVDGDVQTITTEYVFSNATTISFITAPADGTAVLIKRVTSSDDLKATFYPGSAIRARDLNDNFTQNLYVTQESVVNADDATDSAEEATKAAKEAKESADQAAADAKDAADDAAAALTSATSAQTSATSAQASATSAQASATAAETKADKAAEDAAEAVSTANGVDAKATSALSKATAAETKADTAISTANSANTKAQQALDSVAAGPVQSVNGKTGVVTLTASDIDLTTLPTLP